jgi:hypothetical protein
MLRHGTGHDKRLEKTHDDGRRTADANHGAFGADTGAEARKLLAQSGWSAADYQDCFQRLKGKMTVYDGEEGFFPPS